MSSLKNGFFAVVILGIIVCFAYAAPESPAPAAPAAPEAKPAETIAVPQFPYIAEIIGTEVYVRSGAGTAYYHCGKLNAPQRVTVVASEANNWFKILPPAGSFSWISKNYVTIDPAQPTKGVVSGDAVRIWAGSDFVEPMRSSSLQTKLNQGAIVEIIGNPAGEGDYYKITPPAGAFLYVSGESLKAILPEVKKETPAQVPVTTEEAPKLADVTTEVKPEQPAAAAAGAVQPDADKPLVAPRPAKEQEWLKECYAISGKLDEEIKKPAPEQNYDEYKKTLEPILADPNSAGIAVEYAKYLSGRIARYETAITSGQQVKEQEEKMTEIRRQIDEARKAQLEKIAAKYDRYVMTGILKPSYVYKGSVTQKRYLLTNDQGRVIAYIVPNDSSVESTAENLFNKKVGVAGRVVNNPKELVTLVAASGVEELKE